MGKIKLKYISQKYLLPRNKLLFIIKCIHRNNNINKNNNNNINLVKFLKH